MSESKIKIDPADCPVTIEKLHAVQIFPAISRRKEWEKLLEQPEIRDVRDQVVKEAEKLLSVPVMELPASKAMEFVRNGNRRRYEPFYFERRARLGTLFLAEALEYKGRFTDRMVDEIWAILNEPTWCIPAHRYMGVYLNKKDDPGYPDPLSYFDYEIVDLFSSETSAIMSTVYLLANRELTAVSPGLVRRMRDTLMARAVKTFEVVHDYWWMHVAMNWNPWICSNLIQTANNLFQDNPAELTKYVKKYLQPCMDFYMKRYLSDGGCGEGPSYWNVSCGRAAIYFEYLYRQSDGRISRYDSPKFRRMCEYIADMMLGNDYMLNFGDCPPKIGTIFPGFLRCFAEHTGSDKLRNFCLQYRKNHPLCDKSSNIPFKTHTSIFLILGDLFLNKSGEAAERGDFHAWYDQLQVLSAHSGRLSFGAKAGGRREAHSHNDAGQFILAADGFPFAADVGNCEYTKFTFGEHRFENPILNSLYHNVPIFNGIGQCSGEHSDYGVKNVVFKEKKNILLLSMDLTGAYPKSLGLISCQRKFEVNLKTKTLTVTDEWKSKKPLEYTLTLFTTADPQKGPYTIEASYPLKTLRFKITDIAMKNNWKALWKSCLCAPKDTSGKNILTFKLK